MRAKNRDERRVSARQKGKLMQRNRQLSNYPQWPLGLGMSNRHKNKGSTRKVRLFFVRIINDPHPLWRGMQTLLKQNRKAGDILQDRQENWKPLFDTRLSRRGWYHCETRQTWQHRDSEIPDGRNESNQTLRNIVMRKQGMNIRMQVRSTA